MYFEIVFLFCFYYSVDILFIMFKTLTVKSCIFTFGFVWKKGLNINFGLISIPKCPLGLTDVVMVKDLPTAKYD